MPCSGPASRSRASRFWSREAPASRSRTSIPACSCSTARSRADQPSPRRASICRGSLLEDLTDAVFVPGHDRRDQVDLGAAVEQQGDEGAPAAPFDPGALQGRAAAVVDGVHLGAAVQQQTGDLLIAVVGGLVQRRAAMTRVVPQVDLGADEARVPVELLHDSIHVAEHDEMAQIVAPPRRDQGLEGGDVGRLVPPLVGPLVGRLRHDLVVRHAAVFEVQLGQPGVAEEPRIARGRQPRAARLAAARVDVGAVLDQQPRDLVLRVGCGPVHGDEAMQEGAALAIGVRRVDPPPCQIRVAFEQSRNGGRIIAVDGHHHGQDVGHLPGGPRRVWIAGIDGEAGHGHVAQRDSPQSPGRASPLVVGDERTQPQPPGRFVDEARLLRAGAQQGDGADQLEGLSVGSRSQLHRVPGTRHLQRLLDRGEGAGGTAVAVRPGIFVDVKAGAQILDRQIDRRSSVLPEAHLPGGGGSSTAGRGHYRVGSRIHTPLVAAAGAGEGEQGRPAGLPDLHPRIDDRHPGVDVGDAAGDQTEPAEEALVDDLAHADVQAVVAVDEDQVGLAGPRVPGRPGHPVAESAAVGIGDDDLEADPHSRLDRAALRKARLHGDRPFVDRDAAPVWSRPLARRRNRGRPFRNAGLPLARSTKRARPRNHGVAGKGAPVPAPGPRVDVDLAQVLGVVGGLSGSTTTSSSRTTIAR